LIWQSDSPPSENMGEKLPSAIPVKSSREKQLRERQLTG